jgi:hypothetical protein
MAHIQPRTLDDGTIVQDVHWSEYIDYVDADGRLKKKRKYHQQTFVGRRAEREAQDFCTRIGANKLDGVNTAKPKRRAELLPDYAERWLKTRRGKGRRLTPSTIIGYQRVLQRNIYPHFAKAPVRRLRPEDVRTWYDDVTEAAGQDQAAKSYRLLRAILNTAARVGEDDVVLTNPCRIRGGGTEYPATSIRPEGR